MPQTDLHTGVRLLLFGVFFTFNYLLQKLSLPLLRRAACRRRLFDDRPPACRLRHSLSPTTIKKYTEWSDGSCRTGGSVSTH